MTQLNRRSWIKKLSGASAGALLLSPSDILKAMPAEISSAPNGEYVRLSSNENPYSPSKAMKTTINSIDSHLCRYPNMHFGTLEKIIAEKEGVDPSTVVVTSGSREGLKAVGLMHALSGGEILTCLPTYKALLTHAEYYGANIRVVPLNDKLEYDLNGLMKNINPDTKLIFVCNPNNPTGTLLDAGALESFCRSASEKVPVFVDEVYYDYIEEPGYPSMKHLVTEGKNVIISRTFSKIYGLAGVRIGFMIARPVVATKIRESLMSGTNIMGIQLAKTALEDKEFRNFSLEKNRQAKDMIYQSLDRAQLKYLKSHTNFVFFKTKRPIGDIQKDYKKQGVMVGRAFPPYLDWCRISTGTIEEVQAFCNATERVFA